VASLWHLYNLVDLYVHESLPLGTALTKSLAQSPTTVIIPFFSLLVACFVTHLFGYHLIVIVWQGMTTYESKKDHFKDHVMVNPYQYSKKRCYLLCRPRIN